MATGIESSISALRALGERQAVSANNIANSASDNYQATTAHLAEGQSGSVILQTGKDQSPGLTLSETDGSIHQTSNVDIARELTSMIPTEAVYSANLKALQITDEMTGTLLDLKA